MKFADYICNGAISVDLKASDKKGVIVEMVEALVEAGKIAADEKENIIQALMKREELGSTGIGFGIAVPHTTHPSITELVGTVAVSKVGVDFASLDGDKVYTFFLLVSPPDRPSDHLRALENVSQQLRHETFRRFLAQAESVDAVVQLLADADDDQFRD